MEAWLSKLTGGDPQAAWDLFAERYRRLLLATIRRVVHDHDDVMDVFASVCQALSADELARLRRFTDQHPQGASLATWLVVVVRNLTVDWLRQRDGRRRVSIPPNLSPLQQQIYAAIAIDGRSPVEAYEIIRGRARLEMAFHEFLREVRATYRLAPPRAGELPRQPVRGPAVDEVEQPANDPVETAESTHRIAKALASLPPETQLAVRLFVVERLPAAEVARAVGWPNAKTVYNRVYRALATLRVELEREGIGPGDL